MSTPHHTRVHPSHSKQWIEPTMWRPSPTLWILIHFGGVLFWGPNSLEPDRAKVPSLHPFLLVSEYNKSKSRKRSANRNQRSVDTSFTTLVPRGPSKTPQFQRLRLARHDLVGQNSSTVAHGGPWWPLWPADFLWAQPGLTTGAGGPPVQICKSVGIRNCRKIFETFGKKSHPAAWKLTRLLLAT